MTSLDVVERPHSEDADQAAVLATFARLNPLCQRSMVLLQEAAHAGGATVTVVGSSRSKLCSLLHELGSAVAAVPAVGLTACLQLALVPVFGALPGKRSSQTLPLSDREEEAAFRCMATVVGRVGASVIEAQPQVFDKVLLRCASCAAACHWGLLFVCLSLCCSPSCRAQPPPPPPPPPPHPPHPTCGARRVPGVWPRCNQGAGRTHHNRMDPRVAHRPRWRLNTCWTRHWAHCHL